MKLKNLLWLLPLSFILSCSKTPVNPNTAGPGSNFVTYNGETYKFSQFFMLADTHTFYYSAYNVIEYTLFYCSPGVTIEYDSTGITGGTGKGDVLVVFMTGQGFPLPKSYFSMNTYSFNVIDEIYLYKGYDFDLDMADEEYDFSDLEYGYLKVDPSRSVKNSYKMDLKFGSLNGRFEGVHTVIRVQ
jgi:hypothetical protein